MSINKAAMYAIDPYVAEIYDETDTHTDDWELLLKLIRDLGPLRILEPFCGTGRILIPLALAGHQVVGMDLADGMLARAREKISCLPEEVQSRIELRKADVFGEVWPEGFDVVVLGGNCFYELATPDEQERCIINAARTLKSGGHVFVDNNHMEGELDPSWRKSGAESGFPSGTCADGTRVESISETIWFDAAKRLIRFRRSTRITAADGRVFEKEYVQQKHPVSTAEVRSWLDSHGFEIKNLWGDRKGSPYSETSGRAIFWAKRA